VGDLIVAFLELLFEVAAEFLALQFCSFLMFFWKSVA
jgi:hypothetical protein